MLTLMPSVLSKINLDLLNLVGPRSREQAAEELQQWRPKLSDRAVVLIQATQLRAGQGSFQAWSDLRSHYPSFELSFAGGLGLLCVGRNSSQRGGLGYRWC